MDSRVCPHCRLEKPAADFTQDARRRDGLSFYCRECRTVRDELHARLPSVPQRADQSVL